MTNIREARLIRRTTTKLIVKCPYCGEGHSHGVRVGETDIVRVSHCTTKALATMGPEAHGGVYRVTTTDGSPL